MEDTSMSFSAIVTKVEAAFDKVVDEVKGINWSEVTTYWQDFVKGLEAALPVIETLFPGTKSTVGAVVQPLVTDANNAVSALTGAAQALQAGTATEAAVVAAAQQVQSAVVAANAVVGQALQGKVGVAAASTAAKAA
jgi:hypothetical protein